MVACLGTQLQTISLTDYLAKQMLIAPRTSLKPALWELIAHAAQTPPMCAPLITIAPSSTRDRLADACLEALLQASAVHIAPMQSLPQDAPLSISICIKTVLMRPNFMVGVVPFELLSQSLRFRGPQKQI